MDGSDWASLLCFVQPQLLLAFLLVLPTKCVGPYRLGVDPEAGRVARQGGHLGSERVRKHGVLGRELIKRHVLAVERGSPSQRDDSILVGAPVL